MGNRFKGELAKRRFGIDIQFRFRGDLAIGAGNDFKKSVSERIDIGGIDLQVNHAG
jgi:hypothetical protein